MFPMNSQRLQMYMRQWFPALLIVLILLLVPPVGFAVILAFFTAPLARAFISVIRIPVSLAVIIVMGSFLLLIYTFIFLTINGVVTMLSSIEEPLSQIVQSINIKTIDFHSVEESFLQFSQSAIEGILTFFGTLFQQLFGIFIFLISYFLALRESTKNRYWFLVYFPSSMRKSAKKIFSKASELIGHFINIQVRLFLVTFIIMSLGFLIIGFDSAIHRAFLISLADSIPFLGIGLFLLPMIVYFLYIDQMTIGIGLVTLYLVIIITRQMIESYLWAHTFRLRTVHSFFITVCAVYLFGIYGILFLPFLLFIAMRIKNHPSFT